MSLASDLPSLKTKLNTAIKKASKAARLSTDKLTIAEDLSAADISSIVADNYGDVFAKSLSVDMGDIIKEYVQAAVVTFALSAPNGKVSGEIKLT